MPQSIIDAAFAAKLAAATASAPNQGVVYYQMTPVKAEAPTKGVSYWRKAEERPGRTLAGAGGLVKTIFQVDIWDDGPQGGFTRTKPIEGAIRAFFEPDADDLAPVGAWGYTGGSVWVHAVRVEENLDDFAPPAFADDTAINAVSLNVIVCHDQPPPA